MEIKGKVCFIGEKRSGTSKAGKAWESLEFVVEYTNVRYTQHVSLQFFGAEKIAFANLHVGKEITVFFDIDAREYNGRWYNSLTAWKIVAAEGTDAAKNGGYDNRF
jgi:hypothetical protein|nr:MAG TPA: protein of unknown function (DUF3127) [Caudoviricetes sp.]